MVESRCAMTKVVRPCMRYERPCWIIASDSESRLDVASSRIRIRGSARIARAIEMRCLCPPESFTAALAYDRIVFIGKALSEFVHPRNPAGAHDFLFARLRTRERYIFADRPIE